MCRTRQQTAAGGTPRSSTAKACHRSTLCARKTRAGSACRDSRAGPVLAITSEAVADRHCLWPLSSFRPIPIKAFDRASGCVLEAHARVGGGDVSLAGKQVCARALRGKNKLCRRFGGGLRCDAAGIAAILEEASQQIPPSA